MVQLEKSIAELLKQSGAEVSIVSSQKELKEKCYADISSCIRDF